MTTNFRLYFTRWTMKLHIIMKNIETKCQMIQISTNFIYGDSGSPCRIEFITAVTTRMAVPDPIARSLPLLSSMKTVKYTNNHMMKIGTKVFVN